MKNQLKSELAGHFTFRLYRADGTLKREISFANLILNNGLNRLGLSTGASCLGFCRLGSGSSAPTNGQTALDAQLGFSSVQQALVENFDSVGNAYSFVRKTFRFDVGVATGNISEVGCGWASTGSTLFSRALVVDGGGTPTTIVKLADEVLDVVYEVRQYFPSADLTFTFDIGATTYSVTARVAEIDSLTYWRPNSFLTNGVGQDPGGTSRVYDGAIGAVTASPAGAQSTSLVLSTVGSYVADSFQRTFRASAALNFANHLHRSYVLGAAGGHFQAEITPTFTKLNTQVFSIDFTLSWARRP